MFPYTLIHTVQVDMTLHARAQRPLPQGFERRSAWRYRRPRRRAERPQPHVSTGRVLL